MICEELHEARLELSPKASFCKKNATPSERQERKLLPYP